MGIDQTGAIVFLAIPLEVGDLRVVVFLELPLAAIKRRARGITVGLEAERVVVADLLK